MDFQVILTAKARRDLAVIWDYIARNDPLTATAFCHGLALEAQSLKIFPERNPEVGRRRHVRKTSHENYLIFYKIYMDQNRVEILRFWHSARNQDRLRLKEESIQYRAPEKATPAIAY